MGQIDYEKTAFVLKALKGVIDLAKKTPAERMNSLAGAAGGATLGLGRLGLSAAGKMGELGLSAGKFLTKSPGRAVGGLALTSTAMDITKKMDKYENMIIGR